MRRAADLEKAESMLAVHTSNSSPSEGSDSKVLAFYSQMRAWSFLTCMCFTRLQSFTDTSCSHLMETEHKYLAHLKSSTYPRQLAQSSEPRPKALTFSFPFSFFHPKPFPGDCYVGNGAAGVTYTARRCFHRNMFHHLMPAAQGQLK